MIEQEISGPIGQTSVCFTYTKVTSHVKEVKGFFHDSNLCINEKHHPKTKVILYVF